MILGNIGRLQLGQDRNLLDDIVDIVLSILNVNDFDSHRLSSASIQTNCPNWVSCLLDQDVDMEDPRLTL